MTSISIDYSEFDAVNRDLSRAADIVESRAPSIVSKTAYDIEGTGKANAPVDTGYLESTISTDLDGLEAEIGPTAEYGGYVEDGTSRMAAQPYMGPAVEVHVPKFEGAVARLGEGAIARGGRA